MSTRAELVVFLSWLDAIGEGGVEPWESPRTMWIARAFVACAEPLVERIGMAARSVEAARAFVHEPSEATHDGCYRAGTEGYPLGFVLEGCLSMPESGVAGCDPGSGCRTGAGVILALAGIEGSSVDAVIDRLRRLA